jgi:hypothetical protein
VRYLFFLFQEGLFIIQLGGRFYITFSSNLHTKKAVWLIIMCLNLTYSGFQIGRHLSGTLSNHNCVKEGDALSPLLFNFFYVTPLETSETQFVLSQKLYIYAFYFEF